MEDKEKNIDKFIKQNLDIQEPSLDFSGNVMEEIYALDLKKDRALSSLMQKHVLEAPSLNFASRVMVSIEQKSEIKAYQPVIGKKVWFLIISVVALIFVYTFLQLDFTASKHIYLENLQNEVNNLFLFEFPSLSISPLFGLSIFALSALLFLDYFIRNRRLSL